MSDLTPFQKFLCYLIMVQANLSFGASNFGLEDGVLNGVGINACADFCESMPCDWWPIGLGCSHIMKYNCSPDAKRDKPARTITTIVRNVFRVFNALIVFSRLLSVDDNLSSNIVFSSRPLMITGI